MTFIRREISDLMMFAYVIGAQRAMPTISDQRGIERYLMDFGHLCEYCDTEALRARLKRMKQEYHESRREG